MRWDDAMYAVLDRLRSDTALTTALGGDRIARADASATPDVPGITWQVTGTRRRECEEVVFTLWDVRAPTLENAIRIEERLHAHLDHVEAETVSGLPLLLEFLDSRDTLDASGTVHRTLEFRFTTPLSA